MLTRFEDYENANLTLGYMVSVNVTTGQYELIGSVTVTRS
jgi:hypothetical protein